MPSSTMNDIFIYFSFVTTRNYGLLHAYGAYAESINTPLIPTHAHGTLQMNQATCEESHAEVAQWGQG